VNSSSRFVVAGLLVAGASALAQPAQAQAKLDATYTASIAGLPVGKGSWTVDIDEAHFSASANGATTGLIRVFTGGQGTSAAQGSFNGNSTYTAAIKTSHKSDDVSLTVVNGAAKDIHLDPPMDGDPERVPITDAMRQGIADPMTAALVRMPPTGELLSSEACARSASVFDGRLRYDLQLAFKRMDKVKADKGYAGPAVVCALYFTPIGGHIPSRTAVKYLTKLRDMEVWLVPVSGTRVLVPFRFQVPTPIGLGVLEADQFVAVAQPARTANKGAKTQ
jgi:uncharacterized protein DUF3108